MLSNQRRQLDFAFGLAAIALWLASHPYAGLFQDANLYTLMALRWLNPAAYANDPWFLFGSQDAFTIFPPLYGMLIKKLGISDAARSMVIVGGGAWLGASWLTARRLFRDPFPFGVALLCCAVFSLNISPAGSTFLLNETFATPRLFAIPLGIGAIVWGQQNKYGLALCLACAAIALHPLLGIWPLAFVLIYPLADRHILFLFLCGASVLTAVLAAELVPLLQPLPVERWQFLADSTTDLLVDGRSWSRLNVFLFWISALLLGARFGAAHFRRTYLLVALLAASGYFLALIVSLYYPSDLLLRCQPWRVIWLAAYFAVFALVDQGWTLWRSSRGVRLLLVVTLLLVACQPVAGVLMFASWLYLLRSRDIPRCLRSDRLSTVLAWPIILALGIVALPGWFADQALDGDALSHLGWMDGGVIRGILGGGGWGLGPMVIAGALVLLRSKPGIALLFVLPTAVWAAKAWDPRADVTRLSEAAFRYAPPASIEGMHRGDTVYWPNGQERIWFSLGTAAYVGPYHLSGLVFSPPRSDLVVERWRRAAIGSVADRPIRSPTDFGEAIARFRDNHKERNYAREVAGNFVADTLTPDGVVFLCEDPALDWVIAPIMSIPGGIKGIPFSLPPMVDAAYYAYSCQRVRLMGHQGIGR